MMTEQELQRAHSLVDLTVLRASSVKDIMFPVPEVCDFPGLEKGHEVTAITLDGMVAVKSEMQCDQCGKTLKTGEVVLGKGVTMTVPGILKGSFFSPTCIPCFVEDRGGYYSHVLAVLVMET